MRIEWARNILEPETIAPISKPACATLPCFEGGRA